MSEIRAGGGGGASQGAGGGALVLAVAKVLGADPAEVRKKRDENPQWFADMVTSTGSAT